MKKAKQEGNGISIPGAIWEMIPEIEEVGIKLVFASEVVG